MFRNILIPTDGSKLSQKAVRHGIRMAKAMKAHVTALHVSPKFHTFIYVTGMIATTQEQYSVESDQQANICLAFAKKVADGAGVPCDVVHVSSDYPYKEIISVARKRKCDLILMASHGRRGVEGFLLGSETQKVLTHGQTPVLVYR